MRHTPVLALSSRLSLSSSARFDRTPLYWPEVEGIRKTLTPMRWTIPSTDQHRLLDHHVLTISYVKSPPSTSLCYFRTQSQCYKRANVSMLRQFTRSKVISHKLPEVDVLSLLIGGTIFHQDDSQSGRNLEYQDNLKRGRLHRLVVGSCS